MNLIPHKLFELFFDPKTRRIYTKSLLPNKTPFAERTLTIQNIQYREFDPTHSKLAATIAKCATNVGIRKNDVILYLGSSHGYTISFLSDIVGEQGLIFGIDPAPRVMRDLVFLSQDRINIVPILADANHPDQYANRICQADILFQDIAQKNQAEIFIKNLAFLKKGGYALLAVKARSIDITKKPKQLFEEVRREIEKHLTVIDFRPLDPFEKDHCMIIAKK